MKLTVLINGDGPEMREAMAKADELMIDGYEVEVLDWESEGAASIAALYDIYSTPAMLVTGPEGRLIDLYQGSELPSTSSIRNLM